MEAPPPRRRGSEGLGPWACQNARRRAEPHPAAGPGLGLQGLGWVEKRTDLGGRWGLWTSLGNVGL